jgi:hypothetical protein
LRMVEEAPAIRPLFGLGDEPLHSAEELNLTRGAPRAPARQPKWGRWPAGRDPGVARGCCRSCPFPRRNATSKPEKAPTHSNNYLRIVKPPLPTHCDPQLLEQRDAQPLGAMSDAGAQPSARLAADPCARPFGDGRCCDFAVCSRQGGTNSRPSAWTGGARRVASGSATAVEPSPGLRRTARGRASGWSA